jgi:hypothetical protein
VTLSNPYVALGLSRNPFIAEPEAGVDPSLWLDRGFSTAPQPGAKMLVQIWGEKGAGKTSHLKHWQRQTGGAYCYYAPGWERWRFPSLPTGKNQNMISYWDEADRIPLPILITALGLSAQRRMTIVVGTHVDLSRTARSLGLSVVTISLPDLEVAALLQWTTLRIAAVRLPETALGLQLTSSLATEIVATSGASWRDAADRLHVWAAQCAQRSVKPS